MYTLSILAFGAALLSKPSVAPLPIILLLVHLFHGPLAAERGIVSPFLTLDKVSLAKIVRDKIPFPLLGAAVSVITIYIKKSGHWADYEESLHLGRRVLLMPIAILTCLSLKACSVWCFLPGRFFTLFWIRHGWRWP